MEANEKPRVVRGIRVSIYRSEGPDCSGGGVTSPQRSSGQDVILRTREGVTHTVRPGDIVLCVETREDRGFGPIAVPDPEVHAAEIPARSRRSFGGNFVFSSDSRFPSDAPLPVHDRFEIHSVFDR